MRTFSVRSEFVARKKCVEVHSMHSMPTSCVKDSRSRNIERHQRSRVTLNKYHQISKHIAASHLDGGKGHLLLPRPNAQVREVREGLAQHEGLDTRAQGGDLGQADS